MHNQPKPPRKIYVRPDLTNGLKKSMPLITRPVKYSRLKSISNNSLNTCNERNIFHMPNGETVSN